MMNTAYVATVRLLLAGLLVVLLACYSVLVAPIAQAQGASDELTNAALATVLILALDRDNDVLSRGSGALIAEDGLVLTSHHVIADNRRRDGRVIILVPDHPTPSRLEDFTPYLGLVLPDRSNPQADLALVQIDQTFAEEPLPAETTFPALTLGDSTQLSVNDEIHVLGYPGMIGSTLLTVPGQIIGMNEEDGLPWLLTNATIASGNSGGVVLNQAGELVAIPTMTANDERSGNTISYLRPIQLAYPLIDDEPDPTDTNDQVFCADDFTSNRNGWPLGFNDGELLTRETVLAGGVYQKFAHFKQAGAYTWINAPDCEVKHFYLHVDATVRHATDADTGIVLILRNQKRQDGNDHYRVVFYLDRSFEIDVSHEGKRQLLQERTTTRPLTLADGESHRLEVLLVGGQLTAFVNGEKIASVFDETLTGTGGIGLGLVGNADEEITVAFDNFVVKKHTAPGVLFYDFFDDNHNEWKLSRINNAEVDCEGKIVDGRLAYRLTAKTDPRVCRFGAPTLTAEDFWLRIDTIWLERHVEGSWLEIIFRHDRQIGHWYYLRLKQDGSYFLGKYDQNEWYTLQDWTRSTAIKQRRTQTNTVQLWVRGPYITLTINDTELITVEDDQPLTAGQILPGIGGDTGVDTVVAFDNLIVRETPPPTE